MNARVELLIYQRVSPIVAGTRSTRCQACRHCASILGLRLGAKASAQIAQMAAKATAKDRRKPGGAEKGPLFGERKVVENL